MANNLLDKSSIILTPTAYNNGEALCVKPSDASGDFQFSRNSAATRVNAQGLVENVQILSSNLVQNGDFSEEGAEEVSNGSFSNGSTDWNVVQSGNDTIIIENGYALFNCPDNSNIFITQANALTIGKTYKATFNVISIDSGGFLFAQGGGGTIFGSPTINTTGTHSFIFVAATATFGIKRALGSPNLLNGSITNISVKEVGQNWNLGTDWGIGNNKAIRIGTSSSGLTQSDSFGNGKKYRLKFTISDFVSGSIKGEFSGGGGSDVFFSKSNIGNGTFTFETTTTTNRTLLQFYAFSSFQGSITNISVIEITDDTNLPRINYEGFSYQDALGSEEIVNGTFDSDTAWNKQTGWSIQNGYATQNGSGSFQKISQIIDTENGKIYKIKVSHVLNGVSLSIRARDTQPSGTVLSNLDVSTDGISELTFTAISNKTAIVFQNGNANIIQEIDNVSVKEYLGQSVVPDSGCGSWLFEPQSTNLITQSELFSDASWSKRETVIEAASITLPNGLTNGYKLFANTTGGTNHWLEKTPFPTATTGQDYTLSLFVKSAGSDFIQIASSSGFPSKYQNFNISTGTKASGDISDSSITDFGNGWYRISVTETTTATTARYLIVPILSDVGRNPLFAGNADEDGVYIWGAMLEQNSYATSYIPTEGSTVTRNQDLCNNGGSLASINSTEGVLYFETAALFSGSNAQISLSDGTNDNGVKLRFDLTSSRFTGFIKGNGGSTASKTVISSPQTDNNKFALVWNATNLRIWINGVEAGTIATNDLPIGLNTINFSSNTGVLPFYGKTKALAVWKEVLIDSELQSLTTI